MSDGSYNVQRATTTTCYTGKGAREEGTSCDETVRTHRYNERLRGLQNVSDIHDRSKTANAYNRRRMTKDALHIMLRVYTDGKTNGGVSNGRIYGGTDSNTTAASTE